ncbi:TPM domain-containing protein [Flavobacterium sp. xlx-214]|uniref:TPM domain-containing protein n=1 Tax=unclassified Flavobacterium TaxID=196869 RepID=UPI0013D793CE|nr:MULTISPECIES: TPM domain-containing protein [unclassified Flavobacterium]MBA5792273.1 TPM domain-containing protein [Flavobacterium sp. xlx-221]QMI82410.1 TPM domain-containing protein [Flavobacterium sp. xlx-214]
MKKILYFVLFNLITTPFVFCQKIQFPESFKYDASILPEMKLAKITKETRDVGIFENPTVLLQKEQMQAVIYNYDITHVNRVYIECYQEVKQDDNDAGVVVSEFNTIQDLENILPTLYSQSNYAFLTVDKYLITIWNDGNETAAKLKKSVAYYKKKLRAKEFVALSDGSFSNEYETTVTGDDNAYAVAEVAYGTTVPMGFGYVDSAIFISEEINKLANYITKFEMNYGIEVAVQNVGNQNMTPDMMEPYASHLVFNDEERIKNNIVILFDEVENKSFVYFGTENGKILSKLPLQQLKNKLNQSLKKKEVYKGLYEILMQFEIALVEASGQQVKMPE